MFSKVFRSHKGICPPTRHFFGKLFGGSKKGCQTIDPLFRKFQLKCEDELIAVENSFNEHASLHHLLQMLYKCQMIEIRDKFFYDSLLEKVRNQMSQLVQAKDLVILGISLGSNPDFAKDHPELLKEFYAHCYKHRFLLSLEDKKALNQIFDQI